jgi:hypothetical protein
VDPEQGLEAVARRLSQQVPNAVVAEKSSTADADFNDQRAAALHSMAAELTAGAATSAAKRSPTLLESYQVTTGSELLDQTKPFYFGVAFGFCYKFCTGMPDPPVFADHLRFRRGKDAPRIELGPWMRVQARRVESQLRRDWMLRSCIGPCCVMLCLCDCSWLFMFKAK